jgi:hypothetical protein
VQAVPGSVQKKNQCQLKATFVKDVFHIEE